MTLFLLQKQTLQPRCLSPAVYGTEYRQHSSLKAENWFFWCRSYWHALVREERMMIHTWGWKIICHNTSMHQNNTQWDHPFSSWAKYIFQKISNLHLDWIKFIGTLRRLSCRSSTWLLTGIWLFCDKVARHAHEEKASKKGISVDSISKGGRRCHNWHISMMFFHSSFIILC